MVYYVRVMKLRDKTFSLICVVLVTTASALSQEKTVESVKGRLVRGVRIYLSEALNETAAQVEFPVYGSPFRGIFLKIRNVVKGNVLAKADSIEFLLIATDPERIYLDDPTFKVILDGKEFIDSTSTLRSDQSQEKTFVAVRVKNISYDNLVKITEAKVAKMQVGPTTFVLNPANLLNIRSMLKILEQL